MGLLRGVKMGADLGVGVGVDALVRIRGSGRGCGSAAAAWCGSLGVGELSCILAAQCAALLSRHGGFSLLQRRYRFESMRI